METQDLAALAAAEPRELPADLPDGSAFPSVTWAQPPPIVVRGNIEDLDPRWTTPAALDNAASARRAESPITRWDLERETPRCGHRQPCRNEWCTAAWREAEQERREALKELIPNGGENASTEPVEEGAPMTAAPHLRLVPEPAEEVSVEEYEAAVEQAHDAECGFLDHFVPYVPRPAVVATRGLVDGGTFVFEIPDGIPAVWGDNKHVLWSKGEPCMVTGPQGVGKTTDAGQIAFGLAGVPGFAVLYDLPVVPLPAGKRVLYLALDRPRQIARALRRMAPRPHRALIAEHVLVQQGSDLPFSTAELLQTPTKLAEWAESLGAGAMIVDSLKDIAGKLSDEEVGAAVNTAMQACVNRGIEVLLLHHNRKAHALNKKPKALDDVHGSANLTRGLGSVILLWGAPGDSEIELVHLKQPGEAVGPLVIGRDHETGRSVVLREGGLPSGVKADRARAIREFFASKGGVGATVTLEELTVSGLGSKNTVREALDSFVAEGLLSKEDGGGRGLPATWTMLRVL